MDLLERFDAIPVADRVVRDGNLITAGGVTSGIDYALSVIAELMGQDEAETIQLSLEYAPAPPFDAGLPERVRPEILAAARRRMERSRQEREALLPPVAAAEFCSEGPVKTSTGASIAARTRIPASPHGFAAGLKKLIGLPSGSAMPSDRCYPDGQAEHLRVFFADKVDIRVTNGLTDERVLFLGDIFPSGLRVDAKCGINDRTGGCRGCPTAFHPL